MERSGRRSGLGQFHETNLIEAEDQAGADVPFLQDHSSEGPRLLRDRIQDGAFEEAAGRRHSKFDRAVGGRHHLAVGQELDFSADEVAEIGDAYKLLTPLLGVTGASTLFAIALLASGQNSTLTGTLAGQIVMEGFLNIRLKPWLRRLITRLIAIIPAVIVTIISGESGTAKLLVLSQVILSLQLSFAVFPLVMFTSDKLKMGEFANPFWIKSVSWIVAVIIASLNAWLLVQTFSGWLS